MPAPADNGQYDVFVSYSHADQAWVHDWLVPTLRDAGLRVCVDYDCFRIGEPIVAAIERAASTSRKTLVVLTPSYLQSDWGAFENLLVQTLDPGALQLRLIPVMYIQCDPPLRLRFMKWLDLREPDANALAQLLAAIKEEAPPEAPAKSPVWPEPAQVARAAEVELCVEFGTPSATGSVFPMTIRFPVQGTSAGPYRFKPPLDEKELRDLYWYLEVYPSWPTEIDETRARQVEARLREWGRKLFRRTFGQGDARQLFDAFRRTPADARLLTIDIAFKADSDDPEEQVRLKRGVHALAGLPWELLADESGHLFNLKPPISIRRRLQKAQPAIQRPRQLPARVLMIISRPDDATFIDPRTIAVPLLDALERLGPAVEIEFLRPPTLAALEARLEDETLPSVDILHFDGHGVYRHDTGLGYLLFEDDNHRSDHVNADRLGTLLNQRGVAAVVLNACQSAKAEETNPFGSVASRLVDAGIGSVVAMNYSLLVSTAERLAAALYGRLASGHTVGQALDGARRDLLSDTVRGVLIRGDQEVAFHLTDWFLPALYQQAADPAPFRGASLLSSPKVRRGERVALPRQPARAGFPPEPRHGFHGRARELLSLERAFATRPVVLLHGFGGQGKTSLAAHAAGWLTRTGLFERAAFISFEHGADLDVVLAELGNALVGDNFAIHEGDPVAAIADALAATPTLVVFDNFESVLPDGDAPLPPDALQSLLDAAARWFPPENALRNTHYALRTTQYASRLLLTTRDPSLPHPAFQPGRACLRYELPGLDGPDALALAGAILADLSLPRPPRESLAKLLGFLGGHPLSIQLVLPRLAEIVAGDKVEAILAEFDELLPGFREGAGIERNQSLEASLRFSLRRLGPAAQALLPKLAVFQGGAMENMLLAITEIDAAAWAALKPALANAALIRIEELPGVSVPYLRFHPTLAPFLARDLPPAGRAGLEERYWRGYYEFADYLYHADDKTPIQARAVAARELPNLRRGLAGALAAGALDEAVGFADSINRFLDKFGRWRERDEVAAMVERAVGRGQESGDRGQESGVRSQEAADGRPPKITRAEFVLESGRGERLRQAGRAGEAERVFRALLGRLEAGAAFDAEEAGYDRTLTLSRLGRSLRAQGQPSAAAEQYRAALRAAAGLAQTDPVRRQIGGCHIDLADVLREMGQYPAARQEYDAALEIIRAVGDDRSVGVILGQLGTLALAQGDLPEARRRYAEALATFRGLGEAQSEAVFWHQLGMVAEEARDRDEAERCYKESLAIEERLNHPAGAAQTSNQLAIVAQSADRPAEAERWFRRAIELGEQLGDRQGLAKRYNNLAGLLLAQGRLDEAETYVKKALAIDETLDLSAEPWKDYAILAQIAERRSRPQEARGWRRKEQETFAAFAGSATRLPKWTDSVAQAVVEACQENSEAVAAAEDALRQMAATDSWCNLPPMIRRILTGERDVDALTDGLDRTDALIVRRILERLEHPHPPAPSPSQEEGEAAAETDAPEGSTGMAGGGGVTLPQLLDLVERAGRGDRALGAQLFDGMRQLASRQDAPAEQRELAGVLVRVLIGDRKPDLESLPPELASAVRGMLGRLRT